MLSNLEYTQDAPMISTRKAVKTFPKQPSFAIHNMPQLTLFASLHNHSFSCLTDMFPLHRWTREGDLRPNDGSDASPVRPGSEPPRIPGVPFLRRGLRIWLHLPLDGAPLRRLRQEDQIGLFHLPCPPGVWNTSNLKHKSEINGDLILL